MQDLTLDHLLLIDIDGLRADVFAAALQRGSLPNVERLLGGSAQGHGLQIPLLSTAPSITFCAQASLFTGAHPNQHGIPGNQFFDRFGAGSAGRPRFYAFDVGDSLEVDDAVQVFTDNLAGNRLQVPTIYERLAARGKTSVVAGNMYANGAATWLKPSLPKLGRVLKGGALFGMSPAAYDRHMLDRLLQHLQKNPLPDILTMYFMGLDFISHAQGPAAQADYLIEHLDPMIGELWAALGAQQAHARERTLVALFSDHGQIEVLHDDRHALKLGFPFDREMARFFDAIGLDVHDFPNEAPNCNAVLALNGGTAHVYLHHHAGSWQTPPDFAHDVLPVGRAFWEAGQTGRYSADMQGALAGVLLRDVQGDGWEAPYQALTPAGEVRPLATWFNDQPAALFADPVPRLDHLAGRYSGDLLLISNYAGQFYFGHEHRGVHGGLHPDDSGATLAFGWPGAPADEWRSVADSITEAIAGRCAAEGGRQPGITDLVTGITAVTDQFWS